MIENKKVWVHVIRKGGEEEIACLVATTRESDNVTVVTKVMTAEQWRSRGCAARLLHRVCEEWVYRLIWSFQTDLRFSLAGFWRRNSESSSTWAIQSSWSLHAKSTIRSASKASSQASR